MTFQELIGKNKVIVTELPEHCCMCPFAHAEYCWYTCQITERTQEDYTGMKRMRGCPLRVKKED